MKLLHLYLLFLFVSSGQAVVNVDISQEGADVVASHSGSIDLAAADSGGTDIMVSREIFGPTLNFIVLGGSSDKTDGYDLTFSEFPSEMLSDAENSSPDSNTGDLFGIDEHGKNIFLPRDYVSGSTITGGATFNDTTIADLGLTEGNFTATFSNGGNTESVYYAVGTVPEISQYALIISLPILGFCLTRRKKGVIS